MKHRTRARLACEPSRSIERFQAAISGTAFSPHRHDVYTLALTTRGIQTFDYRGATRNSQPGEVVVLHPDELHDGRPGTKDGFAYRAITLPPELIAAHRPGKALPYLAGGISRDSRLRAALTALLDADDIRSFSGETRLIDLMQALDALSDTARTVSPPAAGAVEKVRLHLLERLDERVSLAELESVGGLDRWQLSRDFRTLLGTSPYRYWQMRRLERARDRIALGEALADAAYACGFSDQAHLTRQFRQAFGLTPKAWQVLMCGRSDGQQSRTIVQ